MSVDRRLLYKREEILVHWRNLCKHKENVDRIVMEIILHPHATPEQMEQVIAIVRLVHERHWEVQSRLISRYGHFPVKLTS